MDCRQTLKDIFDILIKWKQLPNYQAERRIDIFFGYYLKDILSRAGYFDGAIEIIPEFPLKKPDSNRSNKIDYLATDGVKLLAVELKTDMDSKGDKQLDYYLRFVATPWHQLKAELDLITNASRSNAKYLYLNRLLNSGLWAQLPDETLGRVVYIQPSADDGDFDAITFSRIIASGLPADGVSDLFLDSLKHIN